MNIVAFSRYSSFESIQVVCRGPKCTLLQKLQVGYAAEGTPVPVHTRRLLGDDPKDCTNALAEQLFRGQNVKHLTILASHSIPWALL